MKPKLFPLIKRYGLIFGWILWSNCRKHGCHGRVVEAYQPDEVAEMNDGTMRSSGMVKVACKCCGSVAMSRIYVGYQGDTVTSAMLEDGTDCSLI